MPKSKRRKRKLDGKKTTKDTSVTKDKSTKANYNGTIPNIKGGKSFANTFGSPKSSRSPISPGRIGRGSARGR